MWSISELKREAQIYLDINYWKTVLVSFWGALVGDSGYPYFNLFHRRNFLLIPFFYFLHQGIRPYTPQIDSWAYFALYLGIFADVVIMIIAAANLACFIVSLIMHIFLYSPLIVGSRHFYINCKTRNASTHEISLGFSQSYTTVIWTMFKKGLFTLLWSLLFIIPGIIKSYEYMLAPYILAENPELSSKEVFKKSKEMMAGEKWNAFRLTLSFLGLEILSLCTFGILRIFYVRQYVNLTFMQFYEVLKSKPYTS